MRTKRSFRGAAHLFWVIHCKYYEVSTHLLLFERHIFLPEIEYVGNVVTDEDCSPTSDYTMRLRAGLAIDAEKMGNEARLINDFRGIASVAKHVFCLSVFINLLELLNQCNLSAPHRQKPNVALQEAVDRHGNPAMTVHALRDIVKGEELLLR
jgi:hypothetical protein